MFVAGTVLSIMSPTLARHRHTSAWSPERRVEAVALTSTSWLPVPRLVTTTTGASAPVPPSSPVAGQAATVVGFAVAQLGKPYLFGTAGPSTFDCSGLTRAAYLTVGVDLPHYATYQARLGTAVAWTADGVRVGDLVFLRGGRPRHDLGHVGIAVSATEWIHAPATGQVVRREPIPFDRIQAVRRFVPG